MEIPTQINKQSNRINSVERDAPIEREIFQSKLGQRYERRTGQGNRSNSWKFISEKSNAVSALAIIAERIKGNRYWDRPRETKKRTEKRIFFRFSFVCSVEQQHLGGQPTPSLFLRYLIFLLVGAAAATAVVVDKEKRKSLRFIYGLPHRRYIWQTMSARVTSPISIVARILFTFVPICSFSFRRRHFCVEHRFFRFRLIRSLFLPILLLLLLFSVHIASPFYESNRVFQRERET